MRSQNGQIFILSLVVIGLIVINILVVVAYSITSFQNSKYSIEATQALTLAEAGVDKAVSSINTTGGSFSGDVETSLGPGTYESVVTSLTPKIKVITSTGYVPNKANVITKRTVKIQVTKGIGASFNYGLHVGVGGLEMENNAIVNGSVFSNGNITMANNTLIKGDVYVAGGVQSSSNQSNSCIQPNCVDFIFGRNTGAELDVAQSFKATASASLNKVAIKLKKVGSPPDMLVRIVADSSGQPDKNNVLASGTLPSNIVTATYSFAQVYFTAPPQITADTVYWIVLDTSADSNNYWVWQEDSLGSYNRGVPLWSPNWQAGNPTWNIVPGDLDFEIYLGGVPTSLIGAPGVIIGDPATNKGDVHGNTLQDITVLGDVYYQVESNIYASGHKCTPGNQHCHPGSADPVAQPFEISPANIQEWKNQAGGTVYTGDITTCPSSMPSGKYVGTITLPLNCIVTVGTPIWVTGDLNLTGGNILKLDPIYQGSSGAFIVDNFINISNNNDFQGTGIGDSYLVMISEFNSSTDPLGRNAISITNNGNSGILYANQGSISVWNNNTFSTITAMKLLLKQNVTVNYAQGLSSAFFSSGPSGAYSVIRGTYQIR